MTDLFGFIGDEFSVVRKGRRGAGFSDFSGVKHAVAYKITASQLAAYRVKHPRDRIMLIDGNAGSGVGVPDKDQGNLFGPTFSRPTSQMMVELARADGHCDVILCEAERKRRASLMRLFPGVIVLEDHAQAVSYVRRGEHRYAIWMSDPCGAAGHGVEHWVAVNRLVLCDFVVVFNEFFVMKRLAGVKKPNIGWDRSKELYGWMAWDQEWLRRTGKRYLAKTVLFDGGPNFKFRVMVLANYLARAARSHPFIEVIEREAAA
jgi:hypothetical protein